MLRKTVPLMNYVQVSNHIWIMLVHSLYSLLNVADTLLFLPLVFFIDLWLFDLSQNHPDVFRRLVDLIGITSIMEVGG